MRKNNRHLKSFISWVLLFALVFTCTAAPCTVVKASETKEENLGVVEFNGHKYMYYQGGISWYKAKEECEKKGGHLVVISSQEEQDFLNEYIKDLQKNKLLTKQDIWIGASISNGVISWVKDESNNYVNWASGEPNNVFNKQDCVMMYTTLSENGTLGKWNDENGNGRDWSGYELWNIGYICEWDEEPSTYSIRMLSYLPTMVIGKGDSCGAGVQLEKGGSIVKDGASFSIVSSDTNVVSISNICEELDGTFFSINGEGEGKAVITVSEHLSGAKYSTVVQVNKGIYTYNADALPKYYDRENEYNGYIDGMYIDEFTIKSKSAAGRVVSFNVYNTTCACGAVDVYNGDGKLIKSELIERSPNGYITSIKDTCISAYKLVEDLFTGNILTYKQSCSYKRTLIEVKVPYGGRIEITNNSAYSQTCAIYNATDFITTSIFLFSDGLNLKGDKAKDVSAATSKNVVKRFVNAYTNAFPGNTANKKIGKLGKEFAKEFAKKSTEKILKSSMKSGMSSMIEDGLTIMRDCDIDFMKIIISSSGDIGIEIAEDKLKAAMGVPGAVMTGMFTVNKYLEYSAFYRDMCTPSKKNAFVIYFDKDNGYLYDGGVSVNSEDGTADLSQNNYVLRSMVLSNGSDLSGKAKKSLDKISDKYVVRDIYLLKDGKVTQPDQTVQVTIPIPDEYALDECKLYWVKDDGNLVEVPAKIDNGNFVFSTDHFSYYAIVECKKQNDMSDQNIPENQEETLPGNEGTADNGNQDESISGNNGAAENGEQEESNSSSNETTDITDDNSQVNVEKIKISAPSKKLAAGRKVRLTAKVTPAKATNKSLKWSTSNKKYATVDQKGNVTLKKAGAGKKVTITATAKDGSKKKATYKITIMKHAVKSVKIKATAKKVKAGKSLRLKTIVKTTGKKANKTLAWSTSNKKYATVDKNGKVKTKKAGKGKTVTITARSTDGTNKRASIKLKIK